MSNRTQERIDQARPRLGCLLLAVPVVAVFVVFALYANMLYYGFQGRSAEGEVVKLVFESCPDARGLIVRRVEAMGLPYVGVRTDGNRLTMQLTLPADPSVAVAIPNTLASTGLFEVWDRAPGDDAAEPLFGPNDIDYAGVRLTMTASPVTFVVLKPDAARALRRHMESNPHSGIRFTLDGVEVGSFDNMPSIGDGQIELSPREATNDKEIMEMAAARGIAINDGPLPCATKLLEKRTVKGGGS